MRHRARYRPAATVRIRKNRTIVAILAAGFGVRFVGNTLCVLKLRKRNPVKLVGVRRTRPPEAEGQAPRERLIAVPDAADVIEEQDVLLLVGGHDAVAELWEYR